MSEYINKVVRNDVEQGMGPRDTRGATWQEKQAHDAARAAAEKAAGDKR